MISAENFRASSSAKANALLESSEKSVAAIIFVNVGTLRTIRRVRIGCKRGKPSQKRPRRLFPLLLLVRRAVRQGRVEPLRRRVFNPYALRNWSYHSTALPRATLKPGSE